MKENIVKVIFLSICVVVIFHRNVFFCLFQSLALCAASVLFMLSRDRLNMDLEKSVLELMLQLLNVETNRTSPEKTAAGR